VWFHDVPQDELDSGATSTLGRARARGGVFGCWFLLTLELSFFGDKTI
jgi:hypothetical protein